MREAILKMGIEFKTHPEKVWAFGISLFHCVDETYVYISLFKWIILIGKFYH